MEQIRPLELSSVSGKLSDRAYASLKSAILTLALPPGVVVRKKEISEWFGVSQAPVSEAIIKLSGEGLVDIVPQSSTRVSKINMAHVREDAFLREAFEVHAVEHAALYRSAEQLTLLKRNMRTQSLLLGDADYDDFFRCDEQFHALIMQVSVTPRLLSTISSLSNQINRARMLLLPEPGRIHEAYAEHERILDAIERQDPQAAREGMKAHLAGLLKRLEPLESQRPELFGT